MIGNGIVNLFGFIVAISILVAVHEYGHYLAGRLVGMKVLRYSIGFGKPIWTRVAGSDATEYCISAIPLGGYVRFLDERDGPVPAADAGRSFNSKPVSARIFVLLAGPAFNFLLAMAVYWALFVAGQPALPATIGAVEPNSPAAEAGLVEGDQIVAIGERGAEAWDTALLAMLDEMTSDGRIPMTVFGADLAERDVVVVVGDDVRRLTEPGELFAGLGFVPGGYPPVIGELLNDGAAAGSDLQVGDRIVAVDGNPIRHFGELGPLIVERPGERVRVRYLRGDDLRTTTLTLGSELRDGRDVGMLGVRVQQVLRKYGIGAAVPVAIGHTWDQSVFTVTMLGRMLTGDVSLKNISGPITIAEVAGESARSGPRQFLEFLALISISLGILNLLPVPILDGGQIVVQSVEAVKGSPLSERALVIGQQVGIAALILLMSLAFYNDIARQLSQ